MNGLKRIEATLGQLNAQGNPAIDSSTQDLISQTHSPKPQVAQTRASAKSAVQAFPIPKPVPAQTPEVVSIQPVQPAQPAQPTKRKPARDSHKSSAKTKKTAGQKAAKLPTEPVQPFPAGKTPAEAPALPKAKPPSFSSHRHAVNPNLAVGMLKELETIVVKWQLELEQTVLEIQALYLEGPIVDGWLESHPYGSPQVMQPIGTVMLRHAEIDRLMEYVEEICRVPQILDMGEIPRTGYRLCGLDADGQMWSRPCPPQQVPYVSLAIARYQKLRILLAKKQTLETRFNHLIQNLTMLHGLMQEQV
jgi:hypothetical protein